MQIFVKTLTGKKTEFNVNPTDPVLKLKQALQEKEGIGAEQIKLIYKGKQFKDTDTLESWKIKAGEIIHMVLLLR